MWFAIEMSDALGVLRHGRIERVSKGTQNLEMLGLDVDDKGGVWFTDGPGRAVSRMASDGSVRSFPLATPVVKLGRLAVAPDHAVWFADVTTASVTRLKERPEGAFTVGERCQCLRRAANLAGVGGKPFEREMRIDQSKAVCLLAFPGAGRTSVVCL